jgi:hypothetical protein
VLSLLWNLMGKVWSRARTSLCQDYSGMGTRSLLKIRNACKSGIMKNREAPRYAINEVLFCCHLVSSQGLHSPSLGFLFGHFYYHLQLFLTTLRFRVSLWSSTSFFSSPTALLLRPRLTVLDPRCRANLVRKRLNKDGFTL